MPRIHKDFETSLLSNDKEFRGIIEIRSITIIVEHNISILQNVKTIKI